MRRHGILIRITFVQLGWGIMVLLFPGAALISPLRAIHWSFGDNSTTTGVILVLASISTLVGWMIPGDNAKWRILLVLPQACLVTLTGVGASMAMITGSPLGFTEIGTSGAARAINFPFVLFAIAHFWVIWITLDEAYSYYFRNKVRMKCQSLIYLVRLRYLELVQRHW